MIRALPWSSSVTMPRSSSPARSLSCGKSTTLHRRIRPVLRPNTHTHWSPVIVLALVRATIQDERAIPRLSATLPITPAPYRAANPSCPPTPSARMRAAALARPVKAPQMKRELTRPNVEVPPVFSPPFDLPTSPSLDHPRPEVEGEDDTPTVVDVKNALSAFGTLVVVQVHRFS